MGRPISSTRSAIWRSCAASHLVTYSSLAEPHSGDVNKPPLHHLAAAQSGPRAITFTLCRRVVHSAAPMSRAV